MEKVNHILARNRQSYLLDDGHGMAAIQRKALENISDCRTIAMGSNLFACNQCGHPVRTHRSCGNRHCPTCQGDKAAQWLENHFTQLLPVPYFLVTFTLPEQCRSVACIHPKESYAALFTAAWQSLKKLAADPRYMGVAQLAALAILHTWGRQMQYHVHLHMLVAAGGLDQNRQWKSARHDFLVPVKALSKIFKAKFRDAMQKKGLYEKFSAETWQKAFNVHCQPAGNGVNTLGYLSSYLFRVAISNWRIVRTSRETVTFRYQKVESKQWKNTTLSTKEFIHRFLMHVLPRGFTKVRYFGLWNHNAAVALEDVKKLIVGAWQAICRLPKHLPKRKFNTFQCPICQGPMKLAEIHRPGAPPVCLSG